MATLGEGSLAGQNYSVIISNTSGSTTPTSGQFHWIQAGPGINPIVTGGPPPFLQPLPGVTVEQTEESPKIQVRLDARDMIDALRQYRAFLEELDDMDTKLAQIVDDTIFGLNEAIEALERLGY